MFNKSAKYYDAIYKANSKDYVKESEKLHSLIQQHKKSSGNVLLDVACGTGLHLHYLRQHYQVEGLDLDPEILTIAKKNQPDIPFHQASMVDFDLNKKFDVITCLFSAIGYVETQSRLHQAIQTMTNHLNDGGVLLVEPWFGPGILSTSKVYVVFVDEPDLKIARMNINRVEENISFLDFHYLVATPEGIENFAETHKLSLFTDEEYMQAFQSAKLKTIHDPEGLDGRGLYIGIKPM